MKYTFDLTERIRQEVPSKLLDKSKSLAGSDLNHVKFSFIEVKDILYSILKKIDMEKIEEKWGYQK